MTSAVQTKGLWANEKGAAAIEFAILATAFLGMLVGGIYASMLGFTSASMHQAVESAARCRALGVTCTDSTTTVSYAQSKFKSVTGATPSFTADTAACGDRVSGTLSYQLNWIVGSSTIPLSATACFPSQT